MDWSIGKQFNVLTVSINPSDTVAMAQAKRGNYVKSYLEGTDHNSADANSGWHFLTGTEPEIKKLAAGLGFEYKYDSVQKEFAHPAVTFILTPTGEISRYLYGITYRPKDLRLALLEASEGKVGNVFDRVLLFCYHYEPSSRGYTLQAVRVMQAGGVATIVLLGGFLTLFWTRQRKGKTK
jgi:protein SCO1/2